ncbi:unnamed protein product [Caenorhabditis sp. 36 PRJEB53466]|nr:unnamed protein product [Caenorhabditis sp. 36 PRJEB53466]
MRQNVINSNQCSIGPSSCKTMRIRLVLCLLALCLVGNVWNETALRQLTDDLSILERVVNAISIQEGLSKNATKLADLLAELFELESGEGLMRLQNFSLDGRTRTESLDILSIVRGLKKDVMNETKGIVALMKIKDKLTDLEAGLNETATEDLVRRVKDVSGPGVINRQLLDTYEFESSLEQLTIIGNTRIGVEWESLDCFTKAAVQVCERRPEVHKRLEEFKKYKETLSNVMAVKDMHKVLEPVLVISQVLREYSQHSEALLSVPSKRSALKHESDVLLPIAANYQLFSRVSASLNTTYMYAADVVPQRYIRTREFSKRIKDYVRFTKDIQSEWFKEKIADGKDVKPLEDALEHSRVLGEKVSRMDKRWINFLDILHIVTRDHSLVDAISSIKSLAKNGEELAEIKDLKPSIDTVATAVQSLKHITCAPPFDELQQVYAYAKNILQTVIKDAPDFTSIKTMQSCLKETGLVGTLKLLQSANNDSDRVGKVFHFGSNIHELEPVYVSLARVLVDVMNEMKENVVDLVSLGRRQADGGSNPLKTLKQPIEVVTRISKGLDLLRKMCDVLDKKTQVLAAADAPSEVDAVIGALPTLNASWTNTTKASMKKLITDLERLDEYAKNLTSDADLLEIGTVFDEAASIAGARLDTRLLIDSAHQALKNSSFQSTFLALESLQLDFASDADEFALASFALIRLRPFFDDFFGIHRAVADRGT